MSGPPRALLVRRSLERRALVCLRSIPRVAPLYRFQWEAAQQGYVLLFPEGMVQLNATAGEILRRCDGTQTAAEIIAALEREFESDQIAADVNVFLQEATHDGWLEWRDPEAP